jgi:quinoprotein glucose dehydrogenase
VTGQPVWPIEERPVDTTTDVPGEKLWPTQPFPTRPPPFTPQGVTLEDANDLTPDIRALALQHMKRFRLGPIFTPPSLRGTLMRPSNAGGANWGGAAFDPETGLLYVKPSNYVYVNKVCKNDGSDTRIDAPFHNYCTGAAGPPESPLGPIPLTKPPYAELVAIDLNKGVIAWRVPFGEGSAAVRAHPLLKGVALPSRLGTPGNAGSIVTRGGLVFVGSGERHLYAFDKATGREISRVATPFPVSATPMTYRTRAGRQFVVVATGAGADATLVGFALPTAVTF